MEILIFKKQQMINTKIGFIKVKEYNQLNK